MCEKTDADEWWIQDRRALRTADKVAIPSSPTPSESARSERKQQSGCSLAQRLQVN